MGKNKIKPRENKIKRSKIMAAVKSRGNASTEIRLQKMLRLRKLDGWRKHLPLVGTPDFVWRKEKVALFVDGCFWHGHSSCYRRPKSNQDYWDNKVEKNQIRDRKVNRTLRAKGWRVVRIWECEVDAHKTINRIGRILNEAKKEA